MLAVLDDDSLAACLAMAVRVDPRAAVAFCVACNFTADVIDGARGLLAAAPCSKRWLCVDDRAGVC